MKKLLIAFLVLCFMLFAGCQNDGNGNDEMTTDKHDHNSLPNSILVTLEELKFIKNAAETMSEEEFRTYMISEKSGKYINGMNCIENTKIILEEFETTTIPVLDGDVKNIPKLHLYCDDNLIQYLIIYDSEEIQRTSVLVYTVNHTEPNAMKFTEDVEFVSIKNIENNEYTAKLYETNITDCKFFGEITIDGSYIILRSGGMEKMEEFEECFSRLEFVKIGDLLNETSEETSEKEEADTESTLPEECSTNIITDIPDEIPAPEQTEAVATE